MAAFLVPIFGVLLSVAQGYFVPTMVDGSAPYLVRSFRNSSIYGIKAEGYANDIWVADLHGNTRYDIGYDYGHLLAKESFDNWNALISSLNLSRLELDIIFEFLDSEWKNHLSKQVSEKPEMLAAHRYRSHKITFRSCRELVMARLPLDLIVLESV
jgi:hypothetical protein